VAALRSASSTCAHTSYEAWRLPVQQLRAMCRMQGTLQERQGWVLREVLELQLQVMWLAAATCSRCLGSMVALLGVVGTGAGRVRWQWHGLQLARELGWLLVVVRVVALATTVTTTPHFRWCGQKVDAAVQMGATSVWETPFVAVVVLAGCSELQLLGCWLVAVCQLANRFLLQLCIRWQHALVCGRQCRPVCPACTEMTPIPTTMCLCDAAS
jgi:hypothetical protein